MDRNDVALQDQLADSELRLQLALEASGMGMWELEPSGLMTWSPECAAILGTPDLAPTLDAFLDRIHPDDRNRFGAKARHSVAEGTPFDCSIRLRPRNEASRWIRCHGRAVLGHAGQPARLFGTLREVPAGDEGPESPSGFQHEAALRRIIAQLPYCAWIASVDGAARYINPAGQAYFGFSNDELVERWREVLHPEDHAAVLAARGTGLQGLATWEVQARLRQHDGTYRRFEVRSVPILSAEGEVELRFGAAFDVEDRVRQLEVLSEESSRLAKIASVVPGVIYSFRLRPDGSMQVPYATAGIHELFGIEAAVLAEDANPIFGAALPQELAHLQASILESARTLGIWRGHFRYQHPTKGVRWMEGVSVPSREADGSTLWHGVITDITHHKSQEEELRDAQQRFNTLVRVSPAIIHTFHQAPDGQFTFPFAPAAMEGLCGVSPEELAHDVRRLFDRVHPADIERVAQVTETSARQLTPWDVQFRIQHPDRGLIWVEGHTVPVRDPDGGTTWHGVVIDITERKQLEQQLQIRTDALDNSMTAFAIVRDRKFLYANRTYLRLWGYDRLSEILGTSPAGHALDPETATAITTMVRRDGTYLGEFTAQRRDGSTFEVRMQLQRLVSEDGVETYFGTAIDITEEKQARVALQKMADAFQQAAIGIAMGRPGTDTIMACNPAYCRLAGRTSEQIQAMPLIELYAPEDHPLLREKIAEAESYGSCRFEARIQHPDRTLVDVQVDIRTVYRDDGSVAYRVTTVQNITDRKMAEESLRATRDRLHAIDRASPVPIVAISPSGTVFHWNRAAESLFGWRAEEVLGHRLPIIPPDLEPEYEQLSERVLAGMPFTETTRRRTRDGRQLQVRVSTSPLHDEQGTRIGFVALYVDLTEQKALEEALRASEERFSLAFEASPSGTLLIRTADRRVLEVNRAFEEMIGLSRSTLIGRTTGEMFHIIDEETQVRLWGVLAREGRVAQADCPFMRADGQHRQATLWAELIQMDGDELVSVVFLDVTDRRQAEQALRESRERLRLFIEHAPASLAMLDRDMRYLNVSRRWLADYNLGHIDLTGRSHYEVFPEVPDRWREIHQRALAGEIIREDADEFVRADGTVQVLRWEVRPWRNPDGRVGGILIFSEDITASLKAQADLGESEARFRQLAESIHEVFWLTDTAKNQVIYISPGYQQIWGRPPETLYQDPKDWLEAIHPEDREQVLHAATTKQALGTYDEEYRVVRPDGTVRWVRDRAFPVRDVTGHITRIAGVAEDITARRQLESQVRQTQKMESVGLLAGGVAHDFNNWLTVISGSTELLVMETPEQDSEHHQLLQEIQHAAERATALTRQLLAFSRREVVEPRILDLNSVILDTEKMLRRLLGEDIQLETSLASALGMVRVDPGQWTQVLMNLAVNARDAMPTGGRLLMETRSAVLTEGARAEALGLKPGEYVVLTIADSGCGMSPEVRARIFEPFFTTKGIGKGTGLGLAVVHGIVTQSAGSIVVTSEPGRGTSFTIHVPVTGGTSRSAGVTTAAGMLRGSETVLLVEDEESIRRVAVQGLRAHGYHVLHAGDGHEALHVLEQLGAKLDVLVTDVVMPRMSGRELAEAVLRTHPEARVLYTSGYTDDAVVRHGIMQSEVAFLSKPYTPSVLLRKLREVLDGAPRP
ncbi:MAG: PAS domain S-box protein [Gemmatimonadales bacterium]